MSGDGLKVVLISALPVIISLLVIWTELHVVALHLRLVFIALLSAVGFYATYRLIPAVAPLCVKAQMTGLDINKQSSTPIPESLGLPCGVVYLTIVIIFQIFFSSMMGEYNAAMTSICFMILLGFADDVLDLRWLIKISLSFLATLPLLVAYSGPTTVTVPLPVRFLLGYSIDLGILYHVYMMLLAVFCTNSINILAGINGLEVGQSVVIGCSLLIHESFQLILTATSPHTLSTSSSSYPVHSHSLIGDLAHHMNMSIGFDMDMDMEGPLREYRNHLLSITLTLPFIATSAALLVYNWYPSRVFVGDTYTYFAGMTLAVIGILGHCSKTLMMFFIPQFLNFFISLPQLIGFIPCPRHRLPRLNPKTGKLEGVRSHWNLVNWTLILLGPMTERNLCIVILAFQVLCSIFTFVVRYLAANYFYEKI